MPLAICKSRIWYGDSLHPDSEPDHFISKYVGVIRRTRDRGGKTFNVGPAKKCTRIDEKTPA